jgi:hypothetical protein
VEFDGVENMVGLVVGFEVELGDWSLAELEAACGPWSLPNERDLWFKLHSCPKRPSIFAGPGRLELGREARIAEQSPETTL